MNRLYYGDNLDILRRKIASGSVDLCYIDPPFNSKRNYFQIYNNQGAEDRAQAQAFVDTWSWGEEAEEGLAYILDIERLQGDARGVRWTEQTVALIRGLEPVLGKGSLLAYLVHMTLRIVEIHRVLKPTGSFYFHCDPTASHYLKLVLDAVFCGQGGDFASEIIWQRTTPKGLAFTRFASNHDTILSYRKSSSFVWNADHKPHSSEYLERYNLVDETTGRRFQATSLLNPNPDRPNLTYEFGGHHKVWRWSKERMQQAAEEGEIYFPPRGGVPRQKRFLDEQEGVPLNDVWTDIPPINSQAQERLGYPTQKPEALLERIVRASSNEGDTVLDAYCGCGTTVAVAQRLGRRWIGIDITYQSIALILKRFQDSYEKNGTWPEVEANIQLDGVPRDLDSAMALANRKDDKTRKEFEKWAVLTYSRNQARINDKKGADGGVDGVAYFLKDKGENGKAIFQVKSRPGTRADLATLNSDRLREKAEFGFLLCTALPTKPMRDEILAAGRYKNPLLQREDDRLQVVTIAELFAPHNRRLDLPMARADALRAAAALGDADKQAALDL